MVSELFPALGALADDLCVFRTLHTDILEHFQATLAMHTGSATVPLPSLGAWLSYGLGTFNPNLPPYVVFCEHLPYAGAQQAIDSAWTLEVGAYTVVSLPAKIPSISNER